MSDYCKYFITWPLLGSLEPNPFQIYLHYVCTLFLSLSFHSHPPCIHTVTSAHTHAHMLHSVHICSVLCGLASHDIITGGGLSQRGADPESLLSGPQGERNRLVYIAIYKTDKTSSILYSKTHFLENYTEMMLNCVFKEVDLALCSRILNTFSVAI